MNSLAKACAYCHTPITAIAIMGMKHEFFGKVSSRYRGRNSEFLSWGWSCAAGLMVFVSLCCLAVVAVGADAGDPSGSKGFWFAGRELYPIDDQISVVRVADMDGDGLHDIIVANNTRSKINILYNMSGRTNVPVGGERRRMLKINELPPDARFRLESIPSEKRIAAMVVRDLNGDGRPDIAYYGEPRELVLTYNLGSNTWSTKRVRLLDGLLSPNALEAGDLNGDGLVDLAVLGERAVHVLFQRADGTMAEPVQMHFTGNVRGLHLADLNRDGRLDMVLVDWESEYPIRVRYQEETGEFGPEIFFELPRLRAYAVDVFGTNREPLVATIALNSGRGGLWRFVTRRAEPLVSGFVAGQFCVWPFSRVEKGRRGVCWADTDGDGRLDLVVAEPESGELTLYCQRADGGLGAPKRFPSLSGIVSIESADWDGDGTNELFVLSMQERQVGVTRQDATGRIPFPELIQVGGRPIAITVGRFSPAGVPELVVMVEKDDVRSLVFAGATGINRIWKLAENYRSDPSAMLVLDVDQDGLNDVVVLTPYEKIKILRQRGADGVEEVDLAPPGGVVENLWAAVMDVDLDGKPELILPQKNFVRAVVLRRVVDASDSSGTGSGWAWIIKDQINGVAGNSVLAGATLLSGPSTNPPVLCLLDVDRHCLSFCVRNEVGAWAVVRNVDLPVWAFERVQPLALGSWHTNAVGLVGPAGAGWLKLDGLVLALEETDSYETPIRDGRLLDVIPGDLNNDGLTDLVFLEVQKNHIEVVEVSPDFKLIPGTRWQVFEDASLRVRRMSSSGYEPREAVVADVTGDGKNDLIILVHDRVIVYPAD